MQDRRSKAERMSPTERRAAFSLAGIFTFRMLGLFMVLPVFALHAPGYDGYTPLLAGVAIGAYGLTQALLQIPFGMLSDRLGRRPVILAGLLIFALGSAVAAMADSMLGVILGRALQGTGAVASAVLALAADLTREEHRTKAMAIIGVSIGASFALAMVLGPALAASAGMAGVFWTTAALALAGIGVLVLLVPTSEGQRFHRDAQPVISQVGTVLADTQLVRLDLGIFVLHLIMTATFVALPIVLRDLGGLTGNEHTAFYLLVLLASIILMVPFVMLADRRDAHKAVFVGAILVLGLAEAGLALLGTGLWPIAVFVVLYFAAINVLEASLPSMVSRLAPADRKGTALGVYSTSQYLGAFAGGVLGGWLLGQLEATAVFGLGAVAAALWVLLAVGQRNPGKLSSRLLRVGPVAPEAADALARRLLGIDGVEEAVVVADDGIAYLKVNRGTLDVAALDAYKGNGGD